MNEIPFSWHHLGDACKTFHSIIGDKWKILYHLWISFSCYVLVVPLTWHLKTSRTPHPLDVHRKDSWTSFAVFQRLENCQLLLLHKPLKGRNVFWITPGPWSSSVLWHYRIGLQDCMTGPWSLYTCKYMQINSNKHFESLNGREFVIRICGLKQKTRHNHWWIISLVKPVEGFDFEGHTMRVWCFTTSACLNFCASGAPKTSSLQ